MKEFNIQVTKKIVENYNVHAENEEEALLIYETEGQKTEENEEIENEEIV